MYGLRLQIDLSPEAEVMNNGARPPGRPDLDKLIRHHRRRALIHSLGCLLLIAVAVALGLWWAGIGRG